MGQDDLTNQSDIRILSGLEHAIKCGECTQPFIAELRRRLHTLRMEEMLYHVDSYLEKADRSDCGGAA